MKESGRIRIPVYDCKYEEKNGAIELRIVSDTKPDEAAISVDATLEDMYLYYFKEDGNEAIMEF